jgi:metallothionein
MSTVDNETGTILTCTNDECACRLRIEEPCPHGGTYTCACGHPFAAAFRAPLADEPA